LRVVKKSRKDYMMEQKNKKKKPNLIFILTDQQPIRGVGCYGKSVCKTPNIDRIAHEGVCFSQQHIAAFPCCPSRASILTGLYAHNHGVMVNEVELDPNIPTLGTIMQNEGYTTAYIGKSHLGGSMYRDLEEPAVKTGNLYRDNPFRSNFRLERIQNSDPEYTEEVTGTFYVKTLDGYKFKAVEGGTGEDLPAMGFDHWVGAWKHYKQYLSEKGLHDALEKSPYIGNHTTYTPYGIWDDSVHNYSLLDEEDHQDAFLANHAVEYIRSRAEEDQPFALVVSFFGPHHPVAPPKPWDEMYSMDDIEIPKNYTDPRKRDNYIADSWTHDQIKDYTRRYWGYCSFIDYQVGKVLDALDQYHLASDTMVAFMSDHGDMVGGHGQVFKGESSGYDELMRAPLVMRFPGRIPQGVQSDALVCNIDVLPTALELIGAQSPQSIDGKSFAGLISEEGSEQKKHRDTVFTYIQRGNFSAVTEKWRYTLNRVRNNKDELYDRVGDPDELHNLAQDPAYSEVVRDMDCRIQNWLSSTGYPYMDHIKNKK
jgi:arylsulfatase